MPYRDPDPSDPAILIGVSLPADEGTVSEMAYVFAEEFARMGLSAGELLGVFRNPFYAAAHQAYRALGEEAVREIIGECVGALGRGRSSPVRHSPSTPRELRDGPGS